MLESVYKLRYSKTQRRKWDAAAALQGKDLSEWMRESLDEEATQDLDAA